MDVVDDQESGVASPLAGAIWSIEKPPLLSPKYASGSDPKASLSDTRFVREWTRKAGEQIVRGKRKESHLVRCFCLATKRCMNLAPSFL